LATQGDLLYHGLLEPGVDAHAVHFESVQEKEWYYSWFDPGVWQKKGRHFLTSPANGHKKKVLYKWGPTAIKDNAVQLLFPR